VQDIAPNALASVPHTIRGHFLLHVYAAIYHLIHYIRRLSTIGGEELETTFETYPFLKKYLTDILQYMPQEITWEAAIGWWEREITGWEEASDTYLPLRALTTRGNVTFRGRMALILVGLVEEDSRLLYRRPCLELVGQVIMDEGTQGEVDPWSICQPLLASGLIEVINREAPRAEWVLRVPSLLWDVLRGELNAQPAQWCRYHASETFPPIPALIFPEAFQQRLAQLPALMTSGKATAIVLRAMQGSERLQVLGAVARAFGSNVIEVDLSAHRAGEKTDPLGREWEHLGPLCTMTNSLPVLIYDLGPGETMELPLLTGYQGPVGILTGFEGGLRGRVAEKAVTLALPAPKLTQRTRYWLEALGGHPVENLPEISAQLHMPGGYIRQAATMAMVHAALDRREVVRMDDIREACRALNRQCLDTLAVRLNVEGSEGSWNNLVVSEATASKFQELERRCRHREELLEHLGPAFGMEVNCGVRALFTGASGTGKTLAAKILAAVLGMDLYRVDLAAVVNKYIGETEKNLHRVLSTAEELDVILLLDEGDALLGNRTEVKSANDRYANLETNYLLQRLEHYQGIVLVTTNAGENIDKAFQRRMDVVVNFIPPQAQERWHIWQLHLPADHAVDGAYLEEVALRCAMTGGQIRNAALLATLLALDEGSSVVTRWHLEGAIHSEYRKAGAICPLNTNGRAVAEYGGIEAFLDALSS
jgi:ATPase family associated with various cellular activities (AAA)